MQKEIIENVLYDPGFDKDWHMSLSERAAVIHVLKQIQPEASIEIGTFRCGSLRPISTYSKSVYTFDIDANQHRVKESFPNVTFVTGDTAATLGPVIDHINKNDINLNFILIDGTHEADGVRADITECLKYIPKNRPTAILMHDSWNPKVRAGIMSAPWKDCAHVHDVELDFVNGHLSNRADIQGQLWGGLAAAIMLPEKRTDELSIRQTCNHTLKMLWEHSIYKS